MMLDWNQYRQQVSARVKEIGQLSPDLLVLQPRPSQQDKGEGDLGDYEAVAQTLRGAVGGPAATL